MSEYLLYEGFKWLKNVDKFDVIKINKKSSIGYLLEVDLQYPDELNELRNNYPLTHYRNLQLYFSLGLKLTKIHKVLKFSSLTA